MRGRSPANKTSVCEQDDNEADSVPCEQLHLIQNALPLNPAHAHVHDNAYAQQGGEQ